MTTLRVRVEFDAELHASSAAPWARPVVDALAANPRFAAAWIAAVLQAHPLLAATAIAHASPADAFAIADGIAPLLRAVVAETHVADMPTNPGRLYGDVLRGIRLYPLVDPLADPSGDDA